jgi:hypothetical protein
MAGNYPNPSSQYFNSGGVVSPKSRISQPWILSRQLELINMLYSQEPASASAAIVALHNDTSNLHDSKYLYNLKLGCERIEVRANELFCLKPSDVKTKSSLFSRRQSFISLTKINLMWKELILLLQRKGLLPNKLLKDSENALFLDVDEKVSLNE